MKNKDSKLKYFPELIHTIIICLLLSQYIGGNIKNLISLIIFTYFICEITAFIRSIITNDHINRTNVFLQIWRNTPSIIIIFLLYRFLYLDSLVLLISMIIFLLVSVIRNNTSSGIARGTAANELIRQLILSLIIIEEFKLQSSLLMSTILIMHSITLNLPLKIEKGIKNIDFYFENIRFTNNRIVDNQMILDKIKIPLFGILFVILSILLSFMYPIISPIFLILYLIIFVYSIIFSIKNKIFNLE